LNKHNSTYQISNISAVFPAYNDSATIASMVVTARLALLQVTDNFEIIVVNDGSQDNTTDVLEALSALIPELKIIQHSSNYGYGAALRSGFSAAAKEWIFYTDGDGQYNPLELVNLVQALQSNTDIVNGYKIARNDPFYRIVIGWVYNRSIKWLFGLTLRDIDCDFRLIRRKIFEQITLESDSGTICVEMVKKFQNAGCEFIEVPVHHYHRSVGVSQFFRWSRLWRTAKHLVLLWWKLVIKKSNHS
jgi:glycosyltransferase involved in cell wall biosynthesis